MSKAANLVLENENLKKVWYRSLVVLLSHHFCLPSPLPLFFIWMRHLFKILFFINLFFLDDVCPIIHSLTFCDISGDKEKEMALKEYHSLETTNKHLKAQVRCSAIVEI